MVSRDELITTIHQIIGKELLVKANKIDDNANGVQVHGSEKVTKLVLGVSTNLNFFEEAVSAGAQFCLFHHGLPLTPRYLYNARLNLSQQATLRFVFAHNLTVAGYHYSLDAHPEIGNNATILKLLGAKRLDQPYFEEWGWVGKFAKAIEVEKLAKLCAGIFDHDIFAVYSGPKKIKKIGVCSGGAKPVGLQINEIQEKGIDLHLAGEIGESNPAIARECGFNYFAAGHYATEVFGIQELGKKLKSHYKDKLEIEFIDLPNPL